MSFGGFFSALLVQLEMGEIGMPMPPILSAGLLLDLIIDVLAAASA